MLILLVYHSTNCIRNLYLRNSPAKPLLFLPRNEALHFAQKISMFNFGYGLKVWLMYISLYVVLTSARLSSHAEVLGLHDFFAIITWNAERFIEISSAILHVFWSTKCYSKSFRTHKHHRNVSAPGVLWEYWIEFPCTTFTTNIFFRGVSGVMTGYPCGVLVLWINYLPPLYVGPSLFSF